MRADGLTVKVIKSNYGDENYQQPAGGRIKPLMSYGFSIFYFAKALHESLRLIRASQITGARGFNVIHSLK